MDMEKPTNNNEKGELEMQRKNVVHLYNEAALVYDDSFEGKADYQIPGILSETYNKYGITGGSLLDIGCGTGKLKEYLGKSFTYEGIDISPAMIEEEKKRGAKGYVGAAEDIVKTLADKSVDHITALSSIYFMKDWKQLSKELERVARKSIFVSLEQFEPNVIDMMKQKGINIYNHSNLEIQHPTELIKNVFLWKRPNAEDKIFGDIVFKKIS